MVDVIERRRGITGAAKAEFGLRRLIQFHGFGEPCGRAFCDDSSAFFARHALEFLGCPRMSSVSQSHGSRCLPIE